jgi:hypothetical protein
VHESSNQERWPALQKDDDGLRDKLFQLLTVHAPGNAYGSDVSFAANITHLPPGLRAMAATHCLDISLAIDSITWHFGNFGEPHLVAETEAGLRELGLHDLAQCFVEARQLIQPLLAERTEADGNLHEILERAELLSNGRAGLRGEDKAKNNVCFCFALVVSCGSRFSTGARCIRRRAWR